MEIPHGFSATLCTFLSFLPFFLLLLLLGLVKGCIFGPFAFIIITLGNGAVVLGLWPVHVIWTYVCVTRTERLGAVLKCLVCVVLPVPLVVWIPFGLIGSMLGGLCYGLFMPLMATFDAIGLEHENKFLHCFLDGTWSTIKGSCTVVRDFTDFCFHSYFSYMDDLCLQPQKNGIPADIKLLLLPGCLIVGLIGTLVDVPMISLIALWKSPIMLFKGWHQLLHDLIGREGPFLETVCVPFAGLAILLWPLAVAFTLLGAFISSFFLGLYASVVVYKESSLKYGLAYVVSAISLFDEYSNDLLYLREGSCFPRPQYSKNSSLSGSLSRRFSLNTRGKSSSVSYRSGFSMSQRRMSLRQNIQELATMQIWDSLFESIETNGKLLVEENVIYASDIAEWKQSGKSNILNVGLPAYCLLQTLLRSAKSDTDGLLFADGTQMTSANRPEDVLIEWFFEPLLIMKEQIRADNLHEDEEIYLSGLVLLNDFPDRLKEWQNGRHPPTSDVRRAELEAICRRLQGITRSISRVPTFRRKFQTVMKVLLLMALQWETISAQSDEPFEEGSTSGNITNKKRGVRLFSQRSAKKTNHLSSTSRETKATNCETV